MSRGSDDELDGVGEHPLPGGIEVVDAQEQPDPARELVADGLLLAVAVGLGEQQPRLRARWADDDPPLRPAVVRLDGESSTSSNPRASTKNAMAAS